MMLINDPYHNNVMVNDPNHPDAIAYRRAREKFWIYRLRTLYPLGLNVIRIMQVFALRS